MFAFRLSHNTLRINEKRKRISVHLSDLSSFGHFKGVHFQESIRHYWTARLLEWHSSSLQLSCMLQAMVFHFQRYRVFNTRCHWRCSLHGTWNWREKELTPSTSHWRSLWENPQGYCSRGILGRQLCPFRICWCLHRLELSVPDIRGRSTSPTGLITAEPKFLFHFQR